MKQTVRNIAVLSTLLTEFTVGISGKPSFGPDMESIIATGVSDTILLSVWEISSLRSSGYLGSNTSISRYPGSVVWS